MTYSLFFKDHLSSYCRLLGADENQPTNFAISEAKQTHLLVVQQKLSDLFTNVIMASDKVKHEETLYYLRFGVGRRLKMILHAYQTITECVPVTGCEPLSLEDSNNLARDINVTYVNLRGTLDCLAWSALSEFRPEMLSQFKERPMKVDLFREEFAQILPVDFKNKYLRHRDWYFDLKTRRDPVAHRIPIYVPSAHLNPGESEEYRKLQDLALKYSIENKFEESEKAFSDQEKIGVFHPIFLHHPNEGAYFIYPTIPDDIGHVLELVESYLSLINIK